jgi:cell division protein FtsB
LIVGGLRCADFSLVAEWDQRCFAFFNRCAHRGNQIAIEGRIEAVTAFKLDGDRLHERLFRIGLDDSAARLLNRGEKVPRGDAFVVGEGDTERQLILGFVELVKVHAPEAIIVASPCRLTWRARQGETGTMKLRLERALPTTAARLWALVATFLLIAFVALIGRSLIGALEVNAEISRLRDENAVLAAEAEALIAERILLDDAAFLDLIARGYALGSSVERPFVLAAGATELPDDAPGSAARRLVVEEEARTPLDAWIEVLFGD